MRRLFLCGGAASFLFAACVADDPGDTVSSSGNDAGSDSTTPSDGSSQNEGGSDSGPKTGPCDPTAAFGTPVALTALNAAGPADSLRLSANGLNAFFVVHDLDASTADLYESTRADIVSDFPAGTDIASVPATVLDNPSITHDGLSFYYASQKGFGSFVDVAQRAGLINNFVFTAPLPVGAPVDEAGTNSYDPFIQDDGTVLYFVSDRLKGGAFDIFSAHSAGDGGFTSAAAVTELNDSIRHSSRTPTVSADGLVIYFASHHTLDGGNEDFFTIYRGTRASTSVPFSNITRVDELFSSGQDSYPSFITSDYCTIYFGRTDLLVAKNGFLYKATKSP